MADIATTCQPYCARRKQGEAPQRCAPLSLSPASKLLNNCCEKRLTTGKENTSQTYHFYTFHSSQFNLQKLLQM
jgi:hypothetical protein